MKLIYGDMFSFEFVDDSDNVISLVPDAMCITVNKFVKKDGCAVLGRGCAKTARDKWPEIALSWGKLARKNAGVSVIHTIVASNKSVDLIAFPVKGKTEVCREDKSNIVQHMKKHVYPGQYVAGWACKARLDLVRVSVDELLLLADINGYKTIILPRPGVYNGELRWEDVKRILEKLDDRFFIVALQ